jgi:hypothetical protein
MHLIATYLPFLMHCAFSTSEKVPSPFFATRRYSADTLHGHLSVYTTHTHAVLAPSQVALALPARCTRTLLPPPSPPSSRLCGCCGSMHKPTHQLVHRGAGDALCMVGKVLYMRCRDQQPGHTRTHKSRASHLHTVSITHLSPGQSYGSVTRATALEAAARKAGSSRGGVALVLAAGNVISTPRHLSGLEERGTLIGSRPIRRTVGCAEGDGRAVHPGGSSDDTHTAHNHERGTG